MILLRQCMMIQFADEQNLMGARRKKFYNGAKVFSPFANSFLDPEGGSQKANLVVLLLGITSSSVQKSIRLS